MILFKKNIWLAVLVFVGVFFVFGVNLTLAQTGGSCAPGESYTKPSPGIGPMPCGANQCRRDGHLYFTACVTQSECGQMRGTTDGGNKAGCVDQNGVELFCCRVQKNRCNSASTDPNKLFLCTKDAEQCSSGGGTVFGPGYGCGTDFGICCSFPDSPTKAMKIYGENLLPGSVQQRQSGGASASAGSGADAGGSSRAKRAYEDIDAFCFTRKECSTVEGKFESGKGCPFKGDQEQGYCVAGDPEYKLQNPIFGVSSISGLPNMIGLVFNGAIGILIIVSAIFFIWGAFEYMLSSVVSSIEKSKETMVDSLVGLALGLGAYALLANINPNLLTLSVPKIYVINRISFYHIVYCEDLVNQNAKLMDAGTPDAPLSYSSQLPKGFTTTIAESKCGREYFIEGGDSMAVCMGKNCPSGGLCINCSNSLSKDCKSQSSIEHGCTDCAFGGNVINNAVFKPKKAFLYLLCSAGDKYLVEEVAEVNIDPVESQGGFVTNICIKKGDFKINESKINEFEKKCKGASGSVLGMQMVVYVDAEFSGANAMQSLEAFKFQLKSNPFLSGVVGVTQMSLLGLTLGSKLDNMFYFVNKKGCNSNLAETSLPFNPGVRLGYLLLGFPALLVADMAFPDYVKEYLIMLNEFKKENPEAFTLFKQDMWTLDEARKIIKGESPFPCDIYLQ